MARAATAMYTHGARPKLPPIMPAEQLAELKTNRHSTECRAFMNWGVNYHTVKRAELERGWNRARCYDGDKQWLQPQRLAGGRLWFSWEPIRFRPGQRRFPMPQRNIFSPAMQDEVARLLGVGSNPYIRVDDTSKEEGAIHAKHVLMDRNEKTEWDRQNRMGVYHAAMFGQWIQASFWQVNSLKTVRNPTRDAVRCAECGMTLANQKLPNELARSVRSTSPLGMGVDQVLKSMGIMDPTKPTPPDYTASACPRCGGAWKQLDVLPEDKEGLDSLGRSMAVDEQRGDDMTECLSPYSFFPANQGIGYQTTDEMEEFWIATPRTIPYFKSNYENGRLVVPDRDPEVYRHHPTMSSYGITYSQEHTWDNYAMEERYVLKPGKDPDFPDGRMIVMGGPVLLFDGPLLIPGTDVPWYELEVAQWELIENEIWGKGLSSPLFSVQDNINSGMSLAMDMQYKWVHPKILLAEGMTLHQKGGEGSAYASDVLTVNVRGVPNEVWKTFPHFFGNTGAPGSLFQIYDRDNDYVQRATGAYDAETGNVQGEELNYSALVFAAQKSAERRKPRNEGIRTLKRRIFKHRLRLIAALWDEERLINYRDDAERWQVKQIRGFALQGQTDVGMEDDPVVDSGVALRASIQQGLEMGTIRTSMNGGTWGADRRINRAIGVPENLNEDRNLQYDFASNEWHYYIDESEGYLDPFVDKSQDDHLIHWQVHGVSLMSREAQDLKRELMATRMPNGRPLTWSEVLKFTWEWERLLGDLLKARMAVQQFPKEGPQKLLEMGMPPEQAVQMMMQVQQAQSMLVGFPAALEEQIFVVWNRLLQAYGVTDSYSIDPLVKLVRFKAHALAHWTLAQQQMMPAGPMGAAPAGAPGMPAGAPAPAALPPGGADMAAAAPAA